MNTSQLYGKKNVVLALSILVWWISNFIAGISSNSLLRREDQLDTSSWFGIVRDFQWLELTFLEHLLSAIVSGVWIKVILRKSLWPTTGTPWSIILLVVISNVVGTIGTNLAYAIVGFNVAQVTKSFEPLFMFCFFMLFYPNNSVLSVSKLFALVIMIIGVSLLVALDSTFLIHGLLIVLFSNIAFPIRNIYLKKLYKESDSAFQKYAFLSWYGLLILTPIMITKIVFVQSIVLSKYWSQSVFTSLLHCTYNLASIHVLNSFTPLTHSVLNLLKRGFVLIANQFFIPLPLSWKIMLGLGVVCIGLFIYLYGNAKERKYTILLLAFLFIVISFGWFLLKQPTAKQRITTVTPTVVRSAWVYDRPISKRILANLETLSQHSSLLVYCGTSHCMKAIEGLSNDKISARFLLAHDLVKGMPLEKWLSKHSLYKVLSQKLFEDHLQEVVKLSILWKYGGVFIAPNVQLEDISNNAIFKCTNKPWITLPSKNDDIQTFKLACFPKNHSFIKKMSALIVSEYFKGYKQVPTTTVNSTTLNMYVEQTGVPIITLYYGLLSLETDQLWNHHYGTLSYVTRNKQVPDTNVGDEIQGFPGLQYLPFLDNFVDRDNITSCKSEQIVTTFFNAWWASRHAKWPPPPNIDPILFSIHIGIPMQPQWKSDPDYLKKRAPIGCRDYGTVTFLSNLGVPAYFSGCMTLMLQWKSSDRTDKIYIADVKEEYFKMLPEKIQENGIRVKHFMTSDGRYSNEGRFVEAFKMIDQYSKAKLVITQRIHCALPCVAMGVPVIFINSAKMPGGGGTTKVASDRTIGLTSMFHTFDTYKMTKKDGQKLFSKFPWSDPPPNPDMATMMRLRTTFWYEIRQRVPLYDAARKFGLIPMSPPSRCEDRLQFHLHFRHNDSDFTWRNHRSIESIFRHHPCADVLVHSNTLSNKRFDVFRESGYLINIAQYNFNSLFDTTLGKQSFTLSDSLIKYENFIPAFVLYKWGGIYMDLDVIITRSLDSLSSNFVVLEDQNDISLLFMGFEKRSNCLKKVISTFTSNFDHQKNLSNYFAQKNLFADNGVNFLKTR